MPETKFKHNYRLSIRALLAAAASILFLSLPGMKVGSSDRTSDVWITIDAREFSSVSMLGSAAELEAAVVEVRNGIAIVRTTENGTLALSGRMHTSFHKCAGFIRHENYDEAVESIDKSTSVQPSQRIVSYSIDNQSVVNPMLAAAQETEVRQTIADLSSLFTRRHDLQGGIDGVNMIVNKWRSLAQGRSDMTVSLYAHLNANGDFVTPQPSVVFTITGTDFPDEIVVIGAHQDSINGSGPTFGAPGADDDASGIAAITEAIRIIKASGFRPRRTIQFMAYAAEEIGLVGSKNIADNYRAQNKNVIGVLQLDMTDYKGPSADIALITDYTNAAQNQFVRDLISSYQPSLTVVNAVCGYACSDHASWTNRQYASSMPFESKYPTEYNRALHTTNDTLAQVGNNANHALKFAKLAISFAGELAKGTTSSAATVHTAFDYDGDGRSDISVFRPGDAVWHINGSTGGYGAVRFGLPSDLLVPADYDGDSKADVSVYRDGIWHQLTSIGGYRAFAWGVVGDIPQPGDFDGDGKADAAVFRPSEGTWYILNSSGGYSIFRFGQNGDRPVAADFDGDGNTDAAVFRDGIWHILGSSAGYSSFQFGFGTDQPLIGDFDGDRKTDATVFRAGTWYIRRLSADMLIFQWGLSGDVPVVGDYDGDGRSDPAVFRGGVWYVANSSTGTVTIRQFGLADDVPTPGAYLH